MGERPDHFIAGRLVDANGSVRPSTSHRTSRPNSWSGRLPVRLPEETTAPIAAATTEAFGPRNVAAG